MIVEETQKIYDAMWENDPKFEKMCISPTKLDQIIKDKTPTDVLDFYKVIEFGTQKYKLNEWLEPNGLKTDLKSMHASMFRHLANSSAGVRLDDESKLDHLLHLACRALMLYTRIKKGIKNDCD